MKTHDHTRENRQALEEAAAWFVEFRLGDIDKVARRHFMQWLQRSPENVRAYVEIAGTYVGLPQADAVDRDEISRLIGRMKAKEDAAVIPLSSSAATGLVSDMQPRRWRLLAASVAALAVLVTTVWMTQVGGSVYTTGLAEQRSFTLEDGSKIELNAHTRLRVHFTAQERRIELFDGQALFRVSKDPLRPFIVRSGEARVRAVGTQFDVHRRQSGTTVTVIEGRVAILTAAVPAQSQERSAWQAGVTDVTGALVLSAGEQAVVTEARISQPRHPSVAAATAWTQSEIEFDETPLADAIEDFNRHSRVRLVMDGPAPEGLRISGVYSSQETRAFVRFLRSQPDLVVIEAGSEIRIRRK